MPETTPELAEAVGVSDETIRRWAKWGLLPPPEKVNRGSRGVVSRWPEGTLEQALWVHKQLEAGRTRHEVLAALKAGEFSPARPGY